MLEEATMRTTLDIDEKLISQAFALTNAKTKKELVERSLGALIREERIQRLLGKLGRFPLKLTPKELAKRRASR